MQNADKQGFQASPLASKMSSMQQGLAQSAAAYGSTGAAPLTHTQPAFDRQRMGSTTEGHFSVKQSQAELKKVYQQTDRHVGELQNGQFTVRGETPTPPHIISTTRSTLVGGVTEFNTLPIVYSDALKHMQANKSTKPLVLDADPSRGLAAFQDIVTLTDAAREAGKKIKLGANAEEIVAKFKDQIPKNSALETLVQERAEVKPTSISSEDSTSRRKM